MNYFDKYLKYKKKYLELKGGAATATVTMTDKQKLIAEKNSYNRIQYNSLIENLRKTTNVCNLRNYN